MTALAVALLIYSTQLLAGLVVWILCVHDRWVSPGTLARALLIGPAAITLQMLLYGGVGIPFSLLGILTPWWVAGGWIAVHTRPQFRASAPRSVWGWLAAGIACAQIGVVIFVVCSLPVFLSDAIFNFALPAKVYATHAGLAADALVRLADPGNLHYPPLLPLNESLFFLVDEQLGARLLQLLFPAGLLAFVLLVAEAVWDHTRPFLSFLFFGIVVATPQLAINAIGGFVDLRLCGTLLLVLIEARRLNLDDPRALPALVLATVTCGLTKREGYVVAVGVCLFLCWHCRGSVVQRRHASLAVATIAVGVLPWPVYAELAALPSEYTLTIDSVLGAVTHVPAVLAGLAELTVGTDAQGFSRWGCLWVLAGAIGLYRIAWVRDPDAGWVATLLAAHTLSIAAVLAIVTARLDQKVWVVIASTADRLMLQMVPWLVLLIAIPRGLPRCAATPER